MNMSQEQLRKVRAARSPQELGELAQAEGVTLTPEEAQAHFAQLHPPVGELADDELDAVSGGGCGGGKGQDVPYPVGTIVGVIDEESDIPGALICCMDCHQSRFKVVVASVTNYNVVQVSCANGCKKAFRFKEGYSGFRYSDQAPVNILALKRLEG